MIKLYSSLCTLVTIILPPGMPSTPYYYTLSDAHYLHLSSSQIFEESATLGLYHNKMLDVADSSKIWEELRCK